MFPLFYFLAGLASYFFFARFAVQETDSGGDLFAALFLSLLGAAFWPVAWLVFVPVRAWQKRQKG